MSASCNELAVVTGLAPDGRVAVSVRRAEGCSSCSAISACSALGGQNDETTWLLDNAIGARPGDEVVLALSEANVLKASAVLYMVPALTLMGGAALGWSMAGRLGMGADPASILGATVGVLVGFAITKLVGGWMGKGSRYLPVLSSISRRSG